MKVSGSRSGNLEGRKQFLSELARVSGQVSFLDKAVLMSFNPDGKLEIVSFGFDPRELATSLKGIAEGMEKGLSEGMSTEDKLVDLLRGIAISSGYPLEEEDNSKDELSD